MIVVVAVDGPVDGGSEVVADVVLPTVLAPDWDTAKKPAIPAAATTVTIAINAIGRMEEHRLSAYYRILSEWLPAED